MNTKRRMFTVLFSLFLTLGSAQAWAVSPHTNWTLVRSNVPGVFFVNMATSNTHFCYLSQVAIEETDTNGERATCRITRGSLVWTLEAILGASTEAVSNADVVCSAYCYNN